MYNICGMKGISTYCDIYRDDGFIAVLTLNWTQVTSVQVSGQVFTHHDLATAVFTAHETTGTYIGVGLK